MSNEQLAGMGEKGSSKRNKKRERLRVIKNKESVTVHYSVLTHWTSLCVFDFFGFSLQCQKSILTTTLI